jgi:hypothetical protein
MTRIEEAMETPQLVVVYGRQSHAGNAMVTKAAGWRSTLVSADAAQTSRG